VLWRFGAGSPVAAAAAVAPDGSVYVATSEGKVHGLGADGRHRFTYNIVGAGLGAPGVGADGIVKAGNVLGMLYALRPTGRSFWAYSTRSAVTTDVVVGPRGYAHLATMDGRLLGVTGHGGTAYRAKVPDPVSAGPVLVDDAVVLGTDRGGLLGFRGAKREWRVALDAPITELVAASDGTAYAIGGETLFAVDRGGQIRWRAGPVESVGVAPAAQAVAGTWQAALKWWAADGVPRPTIPIGVTAADALGIDAGGCVYVPTVTGDLVVVEPGGQLSSVHVGNGPLNRPTMDREHSRVVAVSGDGQLLVIEDCHDRG